MRFFSIYIIYFFDFFNVIKNHEKFLKFLKYKKIKKKYPISNVDFKISNIYLQLLIEFLYLIYLTKD